MIRRVVVFDRAPAREELEALDSPEALVVVTPAAVASGFDCPEPVERDCGLIVHADGELDDASASMAMSADIFLAGGSTRFDLRQVRGDRLLRMMLRRIGRRVVPLLIDEDVLSAEDLVNAGLADVSVESGRDSAEWLEEWLNGRSISAVILAARLMRDGGESDERASFSQLFDESNVREGLRGFLEKRRPSFDQELVMERR